MQFPNQPKLNVAHIDYSYKRQPTEVNVWLPLTSVTAGNTLFSESKPGAADFIPFIANHGEFWIFYGNQCQHYSVDAAAAATTRVSLDLRVIRSDHFINEYYHPREKSRPNFKLGEHYTSTNIERTWRASVDAGGSGVGGGGGASGSAL